MGLADRGRRHALGREGLREGRALSVGEQVGVDTGGEQRLLGLGREPARGGGGRCRTGAEPVPSPDHRRSGLLDDAAERPARRRAAGSGPKSVERILAVQRLGCRAIGGARGGGLPDPAGEGGGAGEAGLCQRTGHDAADGAAEGGFRVLAGEGVLDVVDVPIRAVERLTVEDGVSPPQRLDAGGDVPRDVEAERVRPPKEGGIDRVLGRRRSD